MLGGGGGDGAIHRAAGRDLLQACYGVPEARPGVRCPTGKARITLGFKLPASHVIHIVGPVYRPGSVYPPANNPEVYLSSAYRNSLSIAKAHNIQYVAFPPISCGSYGYPYDEAAEVSLSTIKESVNDIKEVHFVHKSEVIYNVWLEKAKKLLKA
ncbi:macro domain-containing protein XCC3184 isoform X2 [Rosa chinensis]|uniref:macro domain-containing protein XCC3184 isoform X2 n=1 Tax=Rosa chinensis TaxID=74649 RepID=UPI000D093A04|nr:macro domain-containing protein XCC3184 isoform X2 [Rosa chinensis]